MKIYTSRKRNTQGQRPLDCLFYECLPDINETCGIDYIQKSGELKPCIVRFGEYCKRFQGGTKCQLTTKK